MELHIRDVSKTYPKRRAVTRDAACDRIDVRLRRSGSQLDNCPWLPAKLINENKVPLVRGFSFLQATPAHRLGAASERS